MNRDQFEGSFKQFSGKIKEKWSALNNDQLGVITAKRYQIAARTQAQHGMAQQKSSLQPQSLKNLSRNWNTSETTQNLAGHKASREENTIDNNNQSRGLTSVKSLASLSHVG